MTTPGSSGTAGPSPISDGAEQGFVGEQVRPCFHVGTHQLRKGDRVIAWHRNRRKLVTGTFLYYLGEPCLYGRDGSIYLFTHLQIREVQPPLYETPTE